MANYIVDLLDSISFQISRQDARGSRIFFEERMALMRKNLDSVHHAFAEFQTKHKFIDLEQQGIIDRLFVGREVEREWAEYLKTVLG